MLVRIPKVILCQCPLSMYMMINTPEFDPMSMGAYSINSSITFTVLLSSRFGWQHRLQTPLHTPQPPPPHLHLIHPTPLPLPFHGLPRLPNNPLPLPLQPPQLPLFLLQHPCLSRQPLPQRLQLRLHLLHPRPPFLNQLARRRQRQIHLRPLIPILLDPARFPALRPQLLQHSI